MKKTLLIFLTAFVFILGACADAAVGYSLGESGEVSQDYSLVIKSVELDARNYADSLEQYWQEGGFDTDTSIDAQSITVTGSKAVIAQDRKAAAEAFSSAVSAQGSVFSSVEFDYSPSFEEDLYSFNALVSLEDVIRQSEVQDIPQSELDALLTQAQQGTYTLSLSMPGEIVQTNADSVEGSVCIWNIEYGSQKQVLLDTRLENSANISEYGDVTQKLGTYGMIFRIAVAAAGAVVLAVIIILIVRAVKKSRS